MGVLIGFAFALVYAAAGLPSGWLADRVPRRRLLLFGIAIWSLGTLGCGLAGRVETLFLARFAVGLGEAVLTPAAVSILGDVFDDSLRGRALGLYFTGIEAGVGLSMVAGGGLSALVRPFCPGAPWRGVFVILALIGAVLWVTVARCLPEPTRSTSRALRKRGRERGDPLPWGLLCILYAISAVMSVMENALGAWAPTLLMQTSGWSVSRLGPVLGSCLILGGSAGVALGGFASDRLNRRRRLMFAGAVCILHGALCIALSLVGFRISFLVIGTLFFCSGSATSLTIAWIVELMPPDRRGFATAVAFLLNVAIGAGVGPLLVPLTAGLLAHPDLGREMALLAPLIMIPGLLLLTYRFQKNSQKYL